MTKKAQPAMMGTMALTKDIISSGQDWGNSTEMVHVESVTSEQVTLSYFHTGHWLTGHPIPIGAFLKSIDSRSYRLLQDEDVTARVLIYKPALPEKEVKVVKVKENPLRDQVLATLKVGSSSTAALAKAVGKPVAAVNSTLTALLKAQSVSRTESSNGLVWALAA